MDSLPPELLYIVFNYFSDSELNFYLNSFKNTTYKKILIDILFQRLQCWGCVYNECGQEAHFDGCLK